MPETVISADGGRRIRKITHHLRDLAAVVGKANLLYARTAASWVDAIAEVVGVGGTLVADTGLSLEGRLPSGRSFGVIFHPDEDYKAAYINDRDFMVSLCGAHGFAAWPNAPKGRPGRCPASPGPGGDLCVVRVAPIPGEWDVHGLL